MICDEQLQKVFGKFLPILTKIRTWFCADEKPNNCVKVAK